MLTFKVSLFKKLFQRLQNRFQLFSVLEIVTLLALLISVGANVYYWLSPEAVYQAKFTPAPVSMQPVVTPLQMDVPALNTNSLISSPLANQATTETLASTVPVLRSDSQRTLKSSTIRKKARPYSDSKTGFASPKKKLPSSASISINRASVTDFQKLPGVGQKIASRIVDYRKQIGRFGTLEEIMDVEGIGKKKFKKMKPYLKI